MTSKSSKRGRLLESSIKKAKLYENIDTTDPAVTPPPGSIPADNEELKHNNTYSNLPFFYVDKVVVCRECSKEEVWKAESQKWWYEVAKGNINSQAIYCRSCRDKEKTRKELARKTHLEGIKKKN